MIIDLLELGGILFFFERSCCNLESFICNFLFDYCISLLWKYIIVVYEDFELICDNLLFIKVINFFRSWLLWFREYM